MWALIPMCLKTIEFGVIEMSKGHRHSFSSVFLSFLPLFSLNLFLSISLNLQSSLLRKMEIESSPTRSSFGNSSSPEFEFWMVGNNHPELEEPNLLTADELFVDGVLLPLHLLPLTAASKPGVSGVDMPGPISEFKSEREPEQETRQETEVVVESPPVPVPAAGTAAHPEASICSSTAPLTSSRRWKDIFKVGEKKRESTEEKEKKKERKAGNGGNGTAELNINIWPFSRSRSAGTATAGRPKAAAAAAAEAMRKSSSAPCSRSNSRGENTGGRRWAASPGRPGVHVGRASPVWQARRAGRGPGRAGPREKGPRKSLNLNGGVRGLNLNVNSCIGYMSHHQQSCRREESDGGGAAAAASGSSGLFRIRALFSKKEC